MVCIAAFIILALAGVFVAFLSIFNRDLGRRYLAVFRKSFGCFSKRIRLQKCETDFKDDVRNSILKKVVLKHPKLVKPISTLIEIFAVLILCVTAWSLAESVKAGLALWTFGSCNVTKPSSCALGAEVCSIDSEEPKNIIESTGRWFEEWGEIFAAIPDRLHDWPAADYAVEPYVVAEGSNTSADLALDIVDPGCSVCMQSYRNQKSSGFFSSHKVALMVYPIKLPDGTYKFKNSGIVARYIYAAQLAGTGVAPRIIDRLFTGSDSEGINYQSILNNRWSEDDTKQAMRDWLEDFGVSKSKIDAVDNLVNSAQVTEILDKVSDKVENTIHAKGIPTLIYDNKLHTGLYKL